MLNVKLFHMKSFLPMPYEEALAPRLKIAHDKLQNGSGAGGDFTGWVHLPRDYDKEEFARIKAAAARIQSNSQALVVIGIGGSYLGARGVIECLCSPNYNLKRKNTPNIYFVGNGLSDRQLRETMELLEGVDFSVNVISKSGTTTEPAVAFRFFRELLEDRTKVSANILSEEDLQLHEIDGKHMISIRVPRALRTEIHHIGNNINQIARSVNAGIATAEDARRGLFLLDKVYELMYQVANP